MKGPFSVARAILRKRDGGVHPPGEIEAMIAGFVDGTIADYQMTAWMMAVLFQGMNREETARLTRAMIRSGRSLPAWGRGGAVVDKHSTGGVGDKVSLVVAPLAAACGLRVPMISGRSLGHTGGTLDKLESIPGYRITLPPGRFRATVNRIGCSIAGASDLLAPADQRMYALRDVSAIVESPPLIVSSILSKKAAARLRGLVLDVKVGRGGFMPDLARARRLARMLVEAGADLGIQAEALLTAMEAPLGRTIGNALEVGEAIAFLQGGEVPSDFREVCLEVTRAMLRVGGEKDEETICARVETAWRSGRGLERFAHMVEEHGGDPHVADDPRTLPAAPVVRVVSSTEDGWVTAIDPRRIGQLLIDLGGGRRRIEDPVDGRVGVVLKALVAERVVRGQPLAELHLAGRAGASRFGRELRACFRIGPDRPRKRPILLDRLVGLPGSRGR